MKKTSHPRFPSHAAKTASAIRNPQSAIRNRLKTASSLITTLLVLVILSTIVIAFMQSMSLERRTSQSYINRFLAEEAALSGLNYAQAAILPLITNYTYNVVQVSTNSQNFLFIGRPIGGADTNTIYTPLFSGGVVQTNGVFQIPTNTALDPGLVVASNKPYVPLFLNTPRVAWIDVPMTNGGVIAKVRFCFAVNDLEGGINLSTAGNTNGATGEHSRTNNSSPSAIALYTLFNSTNQADPGTTISETIVQQRPAILTVESILQLDGTQTNALGSLSAGLGDYIEPETIPTGFGYTDEGNPKYNINTELSGFGAAAVGNIAQIITANLPNFESLRKGGFNRGNYINTLAANLVDYTDTGSDPQIGADYRGVDSYPFVNLIFSRYTWTAGDGTAGNPVTVTAQTFVDLWNPSSKPATGTANLEFVNSSGLVVGFSQDFVTETHPDFGVSLPANGHAVVSVGTKTYSFLTGGGGVASPLNFKNMTSVYTSTFHLKWNGVLVDEFRAGSRRPGSNNGAILASGATQRKNHGNAVALNYPIGQVGDPRSSYYINTYVFDRNYDANTAWGGRQFASGVADTPPPGHAWKEVKFSRWPDPSNDGPVFPAVTNWTTATTQAPQYGLENPPKIGNVAQNGRGTWIGFGDATAPTNIPLPPNFPGLAPAIISNAGQITNICELGNVFDPAQWDNMTNSSTVASANAGGGFSLRIGQPEFPKFNTNGARASQLLDLFAVRMTRTNQGFININTASSDALRSLAAGILYTTNANLQPTATSIYAARSSGGDAADRFADAVIASRPFLTPSQLAYVTNSVGAYFGKTNQWGNTSEAPQMWNDPTREQLFSEILPLVSVRSRNFRVFACGQAINTNGKIVSTANYVFHVFFEPIDTAGTISIRPHILYEKTY